MYVMYYKDVLVLEVLGRTVTLSSIAFSSISLGNSVGVPSLQLDSGTTMNEGHSGS